MEYSITVLVLLFQVALAVRPAAAHMYFRKWCRMQTTFYLFVAQALQNRAIKLSIVFVLSLASGHDAASEFLPGSCYDPDTGECSQEDDNSQSTCSCFLLCFQSLAGILEENVCCEDFQNK